MRIPGRIFSALGVLAVTANMAWGAQASPPGQDNNAYGWPGQ